MAFEDFEVDHARILQSHMQDGFDWMGADLSHLVIEAVKVALEHPQDFRGLDRVALRSFADRGTQHYKWEQNSRKKVV
jgi:hypothetical protein